MENSNIARTTKVHLLNPLPTFSGRTSALPLILGQCKDTTNVNSGTIKFDFSTIKNASRRITAA